MKHDFRIVSLLLLGFWFIGCDSTPLTDLSIRSIEVMQGASASPHAVGLATRNLITVRVKLETDSSFDVTNVTGTLSISLNGTMIGTDVAAVNEPVTVHSGANEDVSLYFTLEAPTDITANSEVDLFVILVAPSQFLQGWVFDLAFNSLEPFPVAHPSCAPPTPTRRSLNKGAAGCLTVYPLSNQGEKR